MESKTKKTLSLTITVIISLSVFVAMLPAVTMATTNKDLQEPQSSLEIEWASDDPGSYYVRGVASSDMNMDGIREIIVGIDDDIHIFNGISHVEEWKSSDYEHISSLTVGDPDNDGITEIVFGDVTSDSINTISRLYVMDGVTHEIEWQSDDLVAPISSLMIDDVDGDGTNEIVVGSCGDGIGNGAYIYIFDGISHVQEWVSHDLRAGIRLDIADIDGDGSKEIVCGTSDGYVYVFDGCSHALEWMSSELGGYVRVALGDVDMDGTWEIIAGDAEGCIYIFDGISHVQEWKSSNPDGRIEWISGLAVDDIDDDGVKEIIAGLTVGDVLPSERVGYVYVYNGITHDLERQSEPVEQFIGISGIDIDDVDGDGQKEIITGGRSHIYVFGVSDNIAHTEHRPVHTPTPSSTSTQTPTTVPTHILTLSSTAASADWPMFGHDLQHTGVAGESVEPPLELLWEFNISSSVASSPVVSGGIVYIVTRHSNNSYLYALDAATGAERWKWKCGPTGFSFDIPSPAVHDDTVYIGSREGCYVSGCVYALDAATGAEKWKYRVDRIYGDWSSPAVYEDTVYICAGNCVYALGATTGTEKWKYETGGAIGSSPAVFDNTVYIGTDDVGGIDDAGDVHVDGHVCALDATTGAEKWKYMAGRIYWDWSSPAVYGGTVYICADDCVYALDATTGEREWKYRTGDNISSSPAVYRGTVYIGSQDRYVYALDATTGEVEWKYKTGGSIYSTPVISGETVYIVSTDGYLYALDAITGKKKGRYMVDFWAWTQYRLFSKRSSPAVSENTVYINSDSGYVFALTPYDTSTLATKLVAAISQNTTLFVISVMVFGIISISLIAYFIRRNYKSKIKDRTRFFIGIFAILVIWFIYKPNFTILFGLVGDDPSRNLVVCGALVVLWMWVFIGLKSGYWHAFVGHLLLICSVIWLQCITVVIFSDPFIRFEAMDVSVYFLRFLIIMSFPLIVLLIWIYINETGFMKKVRKYLNYLYKEKVILGANTKTHGGTRREAHQKSAGSTKDDTRPYYYKVLDVNTGASPDEIKNAYRRLSMLYHPDASTDPDAEKKMKEINKAYDTLSDPDKRARYDNFENTFKG